MTIPGNKTTLSNAFKTFRFQLPSTFSVRLRADSKTEAKEILDELFGRKPFAATHAHHGMKFKLKLQP